MLSELEFGIFAKSDAFGLKSVRAFQTTRERTRWRGSDARFWTLDGESLTPRLATVKVSGSVGPSQRESRSEERGGALTSE